MIPHRTATPPSVPILAIMAACALLASPARAASMFMGVDADGILTITDSPSTMEGFRALRPEPEPPSPDRPDRIHAYDHLILAAAREHGISPALLKAVCFAESRMNPRAVSRVGARGLMQLMPATARALGVADPHDPASSLAGGARYLARLLDEFKDLDKALAGYNAGPGRVRAHGGVPPIGETRRFIKVVRENYARFLDSEPVGGHLARH